MQKEGPDNMTAQVDHMVELRSRVDKLDNVDIMNK